MTAIASSDVVNKCHQELKKTALRIKECETIINLTRTINQRQLEHISELTEFTSKLSHENTELLEEVTYLKDQDTAWYRNPFVLTIFGFAAGVVVVEYAK
jgi:uncharacterized membrane protein YjjP (DUF1212 family)